MKFRLLTGVLGVWTMGVLAASVPPLSTAKQVAEHWAFKPVRSPEIPKNKNTRWAQNELDAFVLKRLEVRGWEPSARADRRTLIRRATMDLTGLMPTQEAVRQFVEAGAPDAWPKLIERLLASPHYGERWGRHWLDVARYADNKGYVGVGVNRLYSYAFAYRDYVVRAFNQDLPFNQFILEQIAADQLQLGEDKRTLAAMGFLTLGRRFLNREDDIIDDRIDVVTRGFMAFTVTCARCHDHKYDPIPTADYYSLHGVFRSSEEPNKLPLLGGGLPERYDEYLKAKAAREKEIKNLIAATRRKGLEELRRRAADYMLAAHEVAKQKLKGDPLDKFLTRKKLNAVAFRNWQTALERWRVEKHPVFNAWHQLEGKGSPLIKRLADRKALAAEYGRVFKEATKRWAALRKKSPRAMALPGAQWESVRLILFGPKTPATVPASLGERNPNSLLFGQRNSIRTKRTALNKLAAEHPGAPLRAHVLRDRARLVEPYVYVRGVRGNRGPQVPRQFLEHLSENRRPFKHGSGRLELARAIATPDNPLTARVIVNRVWTHHFGRGLVVTTSDFGLRAAPPSHPQLLDWLAKRFVREGWSIKKLHRWIMLSATYQQASNNRPEYVMADPDNRLLWKMNRQRLTFEALRDTILQASGQLDRTIGGRPVKIHTHPATPRRTLYGFIDRQNLPNVFRTFDFANPDAHCPKRYTNTVPQQALFLMNSPFMAEQAAALVKMTEQTPAGEARVKAMYQRLFQRDPSEEEIVDALNFIEGDLDAWSQFAQVLLMSNEFRFLD